MLVYPFAQVGVHYHRKHDDQTVDQLGPEAGQANSNRGSFDRTDDECPEKRSQEGADAAENRCATQENGSQGTQQIAFTQAGPEECNMKAGDYPGEG